MKLYLFYWYQLLLSNIFNENVQSYCYDYQFSKKYILSFLKISKVLKNK